MIFQRLSKLIKRISDFLPFQEALEAWSRAFREQGEQHEPQSPGSSQSRATPAPEPQRAQLGHQSLPTSGWWAVLPPAPERTSSASRSDLLRPFVPFHIPLLRSLQGKTQPSTPASVDGRGPWKCGHGILLARPADTSSSPATLSLPLLMSIALQYTTLTGDESGTRRLHSTPFPLAVLSGGRCQHSGPLGVRGTGKTGLGHRNHVCGEMRESGLQSSSELVFSQLLDKSVLRVGAMCRWPRMCVQRSSPGSQS